MKSVDFANPAIKITSTGGSGGGGLVFFIVLIFVLAFISTAADQLGGALFTYWRLNRIDKAVYEKAREAQKVFGEYYESHPGLYIDTTIGWTRDQPAFPVTYNKIHGKTYHCGSYELTPEESECMVLWLKYSYWERKHMDLVSEAQHGRLKSKRYYLSEAGLDEFMEKYKWALKRA